MGFLGSGNFQAHRRVCDRSLPRDEPSIEISDLDLSYTPPLSSPWDPVQMACQAWSQAYDRTFERKHNAQDHLRLRPQCRPLSDGSRILQPACRPIEGGGHLRRDRAGFACPSRSIGCHARGWHRPQQREASKTHRGMQRMQSFSSPWVAATNVLTFPACVVTTGRYQTRRGCRLKRCGRYEMRFGHVSITL